jgi:hypothetical protein
MSSLPSIRLIVAAFVYFTAISLGAGILVVNPARFLLIVPLITGVVLLGNAIKTTNLDELGYATMWLWAAVLALSVAGMVIEEFILQGDIAPLAEIPVARVLGTFSLITVLVAAYIRGIQTAAQKGTQASVTA